MLPSVANCARSRPSDLTSCDLQATLVPIPAAMRGPTLSPRKAAELGDRFAALVPNRAFSMATLQGYLMTYKSRPYDAVENLPAWVERKLEEKKVGTRSDGPLSGADETPASASSPATPSSPTDVNVSSGPLPNGEVKEDVDASSPSATSSGEELVAIA